MPLFDFACQACGHVFEDLVGHDERPACVKCDSRKVERKLPVFSVGGSSPSSSADLGPGACGSCGDPRGPGACSLDD